MDNSLGMSGAVLDQSDQIKLLQKHAPVLRFDSRELFFPTEIDSYIESASLFVSGEEVVSSGEPKEKQLDHSLGSDSYLQFVSELDRRSVVKEEAKRLARNLLGNRLGRVGLFGRMLDAIFQLSVFLRPTTPRLTTAAAAIKAEKFEMQVNPVTYARVVEVAGWVVLHYSFFYVMNDWRSSYRGLNDHEADWEQCWVFCDPADLSPVWVAGSNHDHRGANLRRHWNDEECLTVEDRPVLFCGAGSHAFYFIPGDYVTRLDVPGLRWLLRLQRWARSVLRIRDQAAERGLGPALGAPFVDTAVGDGREIKDWDVRPLDDGRHCFSSFNGLWGLDTGDPANSERGPGGPKFGRDGQVRFSWSDPVGFVDLHGTVPPSRSANNLTLDQIEIALEAIDQDIEKASLNLPLTIRAMDVKKSSSDADEVSTLLRYRTQLSDLRARLSEGSVIEENLRTHLKNPATPIPAPQESGWLLSIWASASVPLILGALASLFLFNSLETEFTIFNTSVSFDGFGIAFILLAVAALFYLLELLVRRHFHAVFRLLILYMAILSAWVLLTALVSGVLTISLIAIGSLIALAACLLFVANLRDLGAVARRAEQASEEIEQLK